MRTVGSLLMIIGIIGIVSLLMFVTLKPGAMSRSTVTTTLVVFISVAAVGLVMLTMLGGVQSLHTGD